MYFIRRHTPIHLTDDRAEGLRTSLNSPVVSTPELPPGPARAAILVHRELEGRLAVSVGVRTLKSAETAIWSFDAEFDERTTVDVAVDAALSFAEGMGFLFDDEMTARGRRTHAGWTDLMGEAERLEEAVPEAREPDPPVLELTELVAREAEPETDADDLSDAGVGWEDDELPDLDLPGSGFDLTGASFDEPEPRMPLSKFRERLPTPSREGADAPAAGGTGEDAAARQRAARPPTRERKGAVDDAGPSGRTALGKLKLVKRRGNAAAARRTWLQRVLSSF